MKRSFKLALSVLSGVMISLSFPIYLFGWRGPELGWLTWVGLVPLFLVVRSSSLRGIFVYAFISSFIWYSTSVFWTVHAMNVFGHIPMYICLCVLLLMVVVLSIYISIAPVFAMWVSRRFRGEPIFLIPIFWIAVELCRNYFPVGGFPWSGLSMSQARLTHVIQIADIAGIYGVMFLIVWFNVFVSELVVKLRGGVVGGLRVKAAVTAFFIAATMIYGFYKVGAIGREMDESLKVKVALVQGNISQDDKWDSKKARGIVNTYRAMVHRLLNSDIDLIVWPESSFPWYVRSDMTGIKPETLGLPPTSDGLLPLTFLGAITETPDGRYFNSGFLFDSEGSILARYDKVHLAPFGEYVPYRKFLFFMRKLTAPVGDFDVGRSNEPIRAAGFVFGPLICYEDIFPEIAREEVLRGAEFFVNITNNAWFGKTPAPYQQLALSVFRAVETRRYLVRATNTGVSAVIAPTGEILVESGMYEPATIAAPIGRLSIKTTYTALGNWLAWGAVAYALISMVCTAVVQIRRRRIGC
jgi:apolipoprotein N-acyltransferase